LKQVDRTVSVSRKVTIRLVLDEWSDFNVRLATMGPASGTINVYSLAEREDDLVVTGTNSIGQKYTWTFPSVSFVPSGSINLISEEWATMEITGTVNAVAGVFGTVANRAAKSRRPNTDDLRMRAGRKIRLALGKQSTTGEPCRVWWTSRR
jgi:PKD repeat protein